MNRNRIREWRARFRQWTFPPEFRFSCSDQFDPFSRICSLLDRSPEELPPDGPVKEQPDEKFLIGIGNQVFHQQQIADGLGSDSRAGRGLLRSIKKQKEMLEERNVQVLDLTGQFYDDTRRDFEPLAAAEIRPELVRPTIVLCETPAILIEGRLVQTAKGIVGAPPSRPVA
jgi:hypothetical protein